MISCTIVGNLGKDAEVRMTKGDRPTKVCGFRVACQTSFKKDDPPTWVNVSLFGDRAEKIGPMLKTGTKVVVRGSLSQREWSANGKSGVDLELRADDIEFAGGKRDDAQASTSSGSGGGYPSDWDKGSGNQVTQGL